MRIDLLAPDGRTDLGFDDIVDLYGRPGTSGRGCWIRANFVSSLDGSATGANGRSGQLSSASDRFVFNALRALTDAVMVGAGTVRAEGYVGPLVDEDRGAWRRAHGLAEHPAFVIVSQRLGIDPDTLAASPTRPVIMTTESAPADEVSRLAGFADIVVCGGDVVDLAVMREELIARGLRQVLSEGGPTNLGTLIAGDALDELDLTLAPQLVAGAGPRIAHGLAAAQQMTIAHVLRADTGDLHLRYVRAAVD